MSDATAQSLPDLDAARWRVLNCNTCGVCFAVPAALHLAAVDRDGALHCPNGHLNELRRRDERPEDWLQQNLSLLEEVASLRVRLSQLERENAALRPLAPPLQPMPEKELKRRCKILAAKASRSGYGRRLCTLCGSELAKLDLHLRNMHGKEVEAMDASFFV